jgi:hypothetical protein
LNICSFEREADGISCEISDLIWREAVDCAGMIAFSDYELAAVTQEA